MRRLRRATVGCAISQWGGVHWPVRLAAGWASVQGVAFTLGAAPRHRAESAWFMLVAVALLQALVRPRAEHPDMPPQVPGRTDAESAAGTPPAWAWPGRNVLGGFLVCSVLLYWPALHVGLLSDDFTLLAHARDGLVGPSDWAFIRPLPLWLWQLMQRVSDAHMLPYALHAVNVVVHALNAACVVCLALVWGLRAPDARRAGLLFLVSPLNVEAVTWASGVFDVSMTLWALCAVQLMGQAAARGQGALSVAGLVGLGLASKETAVVVPVLCLISRGTRLLTNRPAVTALTVSVIGVLAYVGWRISLGLPSGLTLMPSGYALKELVSRPFGALALPVHAHVQGAAILSTCLALAWPLVVVWVASPSARHERFRLALKVVLWVQCSVLPVFTMFYVSETLEGARYLYLAGAAWAVLVASVLGHGDRHGEWAKTGRAVIQLAVIVGCCLLVRSSLTHWSQAGALRDRVLAAAKALPCRPVQVDGVPDNVAGAYVFRNGFADAVRLDEIEGPPCHVRWAGERFVIADE